MPEFLVILGALAGISTGLLAGYLLGNLLSTSTATLSDLGTVVAAVGTGGFGHSLVGLGDPHITLGLYLVTILPGIFLWRLSLQTALPRLKQADMLDRPPLLPWLVRGEPQPEHSETAAMLSPRVNLRRTTNGVLHSKVLLNIDEIAAVIFTVVLLVVVDIVYGARYGAAFGIGKYFAPSTQAEVYLIVTIAGIALFVIGLLSLALPKLAGTAAHTPYAQSIKRFAGFLSALWFTGLWLHGSITVTGNEILLLAFVYTVVATLASFAIAALSRSKATGAESS
jgi:hypothetical protein